MPSQIGNYNVIERIAMGEAGEIFLAKRAGKREIVAIKQMLPHLARDKRIARSFVDAARVALRMTHPNVVRVIEYSENDGVPFIVMERVEGATLEAVCRGLGDKKIMMEARHAAHIGRQIADALHQAHTLCNADGAPLRVVHRDVNPRHVFIGKKGVVKLFDFGVVKARSNIVATRPGTIKGTINYMPPEQLNSLEFDHRADIFALGVTLYECLAGKHPEMRALHDPPLAERRPDLPLGLAQIVERATEENPELRYATAASMSRELQAWLDAQGDPVTDKEIAKLLRHVPAP